MESDLKYSIDYEVMYCDDDFSCPLITIKLKYGSAKIVWSMTDIHGKDIDDWKNMRKYMDTNEQSKFFGGGNNSSWHCYCVDNKFIIYYDISGWGDDSTLVLEFPCVEMMPYVDKIIDILEYASLNKRYPNSE